jgi:hypothetical protein
MQTPSVPEKAEGLTQYIPFVQLSPVQAVTLDVLVGGGVSTVVTSATHLESTTLVLCVGGTDLFFNRVQSSGGFDQLASDFNHTLLVLILSGIAVLVYVLRSMYQRKTMATNWA